ncbi:MAG: hypothetical protein ACUVX8_13080 [Candidatus Zipacnadales bacterium]
MGRRHAVLRELGPLFVIAALSVGLLWRVTLLGKTMVPADLLLLMEPWRHHSYAFPEFRRVGNPLLDAIQQFYPWRKFAGELLAKGTIPLWNPYELCGNPFVGNNQSAIFYPETWLHAIIPTERALGWATALHFFTAGSLMYWFLRTLSLRRVSALLGAVAFMCNGFFVGWLCFPSFRSVPAWLPGLFAVTERVAQRREGEWWTIGGLFIALQFLAGNLHISMYVLVFFGAYVAFRALGVFRMGERGGALTLLGGGIGALILGGLIASVQLLPTLELASMSSRAAGMSFCQILKHGTPWPHLLTALMPDLFGNPVDYNYWGENLGPIPRAYTETAWYVGVLPLLLAPAAFWMKPRGRAWFWLAMLGVGVALAFGTPLNALFYYLVPGAKALSGIGRAIIIASTALCVLAALGLEALLANLDAQSAISVPRYATIIAGVLAGIGLLGGAWVWVQTGALEEVYPWLGTYTVLQIGRFLLFLGSSAILIALLPRYRRTASIGLVAVLSLDLGLFVSKFIPATRPEYLHIRTRTLEILSRETEPFRWLSVGPNAIRRMAPNTNMIVGLEDIQGSDSLEIGPYRRLWRAICTEDLGFLQPNPSHPAIDMLNVKYVHSFQELPSIPGLTLLSSSEGWLYRNEEALPRAYCARRVALVRTHEKAFRQITARDRAAAVCPVVTLPQALPVPSAQSSSVRLAHVRYEGPNHALVESTFEAGEWVILTDTFYPGWHVYADGMERPIVPANYCFRGIQLHDKCSRVEFVYQPASFRVGAFTGLCGLALFAGIGTVRLSRVGRECG